MSVERWTFCFLRGLQKQPLKRRLRFPLLDHARARRGSERRDLREQLSGRVFEDELGLILDGKQVVHAPFADEHAIREDPDPIADFLHLLEQMRGKENCRAAGLQIQNQIANVARAGRIHAGSRLIQNQESRVVHQRLGKPDTLQHAFGISAQAAIGGVRQSDQRQQFVDARAQAVASQPA